MQIVHITTVPESLLGFLRGQVEYLRKRGITVTAISSPGAHLDAFAAEHQVEAIAVDMPRKITPTQDLRALIPLVGVLRRTSANIVHAHTPKGGLLGMLAAVIARTPVRIYHMRGLPFETAVGWKRHLLRWTERTSCAAATHVLCVSDSLRRVAVEEGLCPAEKIEVLANGSGQGVDAIGRFDPGRLAPCTRENTRRKYGLSEDALVIGFIGRLVRDKGIIELEQAWRLIRNEFPNSYLVIAGVFEQRDALPVSVVSALRDDSRVRLVGFDWDTPPLYAAMDVVVLPSYREGFPNVPLEAAAMRKPVVATSVTGCVDAVIDEVTGLLVPPRNAAALASALARYLEDPTLRLVHGDAGRERVLASFSREILWEATYNKYMEFTASSQRAWVPSSSSPRVQ